MKPPPFDYAAPDTLDEALDLLGRWGDDAKILAGGQSLIPLLAFRLARPAMLIDINRIKALESARASGATVRLGALVRHRTAERAAPGELPAAVRLAAAQIGHVAIRNRGTVGGSLAHADPSAEWAAIALAYDGVVTSRSSRAERRLPADEFFVGFLASALQADEMITGLDLQIPAGQAGSAFAEHARRHGDFAIAGVAAVLGLGPGDVVIHARIAVIGAATKPTRCRAAEAALTGQTFGSSAADAAARELTADLSLAGTDDDEREYRLHAAQTLTRRVLAAAASDARSEVSSP
ncbi:MAG: FAD binding domain-containing protein [Streptosporangiaceae bacterium]